MELNKRIKNYKKFQKLFKTSNLEKSNSWKELFSFLVSFNNTCIDRNTYTLDNNIILKGSFNRESVNADVVFGETTNKIKVAVKKIPLDEIDLYYIEDFKKIDNINPKKILESNSDVLTELYFLNKTTHLLNKKICNFLPFIYKYYICNDCEFNNNRVKSKFSSNNKIPCLYVITEKADGDLEHYIIKKSTTEKKLYSAYLQIFIALYVIKKFYKIEHQDLHINNVLFFNINPGGYWKYKINGKIIYVPNYGALFILWDFAYSIIPELVFTKDNKNLYIKNKKYILEDQLRVTGGISHYKKKFLNFHYDLEKLIKSSKTPSDIVFKLYNKYNKYKDLDKKVVIDYFNTDKKI